MGVPTCASMGSASLFLLACVPIIASCLSGQAPPEVLGLGGSHVTGTDTIPLDRLLDSLSIPSETIGFRVDKSDRTFAVMAGEQQLKIYPCVLGEKPVGDKFQEGDRKTPEGTFTFRSKREHGQWHKFIWVDYPNAESWRRFDQRQAAGVIPAKAGIGGEIGIHGVPVGMDHWITMGQDWTWGCIALRNADVDEIYPFIKPRHTVMVVVP